MDSRVIIGGQEFLADLILLDIHDFDVILGMDWLSRHHATVDCYRKEVRLCRPGQTEVVFYGLRKTLPNNIMTAIKANKMLRKSYQGYLAYAIEVRDSGSRLEDIPVVREFSDVFPEDLPGIPPDKEIDFQIELALGTEPISKAPYRMWNDPYQIIRVFSKFDQVDQPIVGGAKLNFSRMNNFGLAKTPFHRPLRYEFTDRSNVKIRLVDKKLWSW